ncbi:MAG TPA: CarD family transcriptional regulator, partial [Thermomicrobiales bacterium]|nr:CarD family transcriptional regulator [Thermomicrobiales bacterium]
MNLSHIAAQLTAHPAVNDVVARHLGGETSSLVDFPDAAAPALIAAMASRIDGPILVVTTRRERSDYLTDAIAEYLDPSIRMVEWPAPDALPYEQLPIDSDANVRRVQILADLGHPPIRRQVLVTPVYGLMQLLTPPAELARVGLVARVGESLSVESLHAWAMRAGYETVPVVQQPGAIARRGGIVDLFPPGSDLPIRFDFFGDDIESIRSFDPHTQRSVERLDRIALTPPSELPVWRLPQIADAVAALDSSTLRPEVKAEWSRRIDHMREGALTESVDLLAGLLVPERTTLLDHLPPGTHVILDQPEIVHRVADQIDNQARDLARTFVDTGELPTGIPEPFIASSVVNAALDAYPQIRLGASADQVEAGMAAGDVIVPPSFVGNLGDMTGSLARHLADGWSVAIATDQVDRLTEILEEQDIYPRRDKSRGMRPPTPLPAGTAEIRSSDLSSGWMWQGGKVGVWTDFEIFGFRKQARRGGIRTLGDRRQFALSLVPGEHVVHVDYGIARFTGLRRIEVQGIEREYLVLEYERGDKLNVPVDQSDRVSRYGAGGLTPNLNRLGSGDWIQTKRRVRRAVRDMAFELIQLYAHRENGTGFAFPQDSRWDYELAESFPFIETPDQARAIEAVTTDMESQQPMDRLVCGDVGFGKTEVAIRAAFKAVNAGRQVAVLVPTTVLAL